MLLVPRGPEQSVAIHYVALRTHFGLLPAGLADLLCVLARGAIAVVGNDEAGSQNFPWSVVDSHFVRQVPLLIQAEGRARFPRGLGSRLRKSARELLALLMSVC